MHISERQAQQYLQALYYTASKDKNDLISNAASRLAVRFERASSKGFELSDLDRQLILYAIKSKPEKEEPEKVGRKTYKRRTPTS